MEVFHKSKVLCVTDYPYCSMSRPQQVQFREFFDRFVQMEKEEDLHREMIEMELRQWQKQCMEELEKQDDRKILWIYDDVRELWKDHTENKADINLCDNDGQSPLYRAASNGDTNIVQLLLGNKADVNLCDNDGRSPLYGAFYNGHKDIVQILLENKVDVNL
ncbi:ankyrin repeat domain-containing protein 49-like [Saccostrea cucullata]|uniref:ankyrin repeat domain-containing protein 49-like n=1 Tax=Saccostrea cuccullata TaxID=36930 RepID=UPI002ED18D17